MRRLILNLILLGAFIPNYVVASSCIPSLSTKTAFLKMWFDKKTDTLIDFKALTSREQLALLRSKRNLTIVAQEQSDVAIFIGRVTSVQANGEVSGQFGLAQTLLTKSRKIGFTEPKLFGKAPRSFPMEAIRYVILNPTKRNQRVIDEIPTLEELHSLLDRKLK